MQALVHVVRVGVLHQLVQHVEEFAVHHRRRLETAYRLGRVDAGHTGQARAVVVELAQCRGEAVGLLRCRALGVGQGYPVRYREQLRGRSGQAQPPR
ncbi:hypothetical protein [Streptomyces sp. NPDC012510]|uniref:hypothetical protein n=1 Tax=Streptomyces sp. NPDC012510 TaxID=3364838 RepID=UPI0036E644C5